MKLNDGRTIEPLASKTSAKKVIKEGNTVVVMSQVGLMKMMYYPLTVTTLEQLDVAAKDSTGKRIGRGTGVSKAVYFKLIEEK